MISVIKFLFFLYLVIFPFGQLGRFEIAPNIPLHLADVVVGLIGLIAVVVYTNRQFKFPGIAWRFFSFLIISLFSLLVNLNSVEPGQFISGSLYLVRLAMYINFYLVIWNLCKKEWREKLPGLLQIVGISVILFGFIQYFFFPDLGILAEYSWDPHIWRLAGTFLDTGFTGILIVFFLLLSFSKIWPNRGDVFSSARPEWGNWILIGLGIIALALTYSRASYLAYFAGLLAIYIVRRNIKWFLLCVFALLILLPILPKPSGEGVNLSRTSTVVYRVNNYKMAIEVIRENPLFGVGYNLYRYTQEETRSHGVSGADSSLLLILATTGIMGFVLFVQLALKILTLAYIQKGKVLGLALFSSMIALGVHSFFDNSLLYPWVLGWILILFAGLE